MKTAYTQTELSTWDDCAEKHHRQYTEMLELKNARPSWSLLYGSAVHKALDEWRQNTNKGTKEHWLTSMKLEIPDNVILTSEEEQELDYWNNVLRITIERYCIVYAADFEAYKIISNEEILTTEFMGVALEGKIDCVLQEKKKLILMDTKTASRFTPESYEQFQFKFQFMFYMWLLRRCKKIQLQEMLIDLVIKPQLRRGKNESMQDLYCRIRAAMIQEPDKYFKRLPMANLKGAMEYFEKNILIPKIQRIQFIEWALTNGDMSAIVNVLTRNMNTNTCVKFGQNCQFLPLCVHGQAEAFRYTQREHKHMELVGDAE